MEASLPDQIGNLTKEERLRVADFINEKAKEPGDPCPHCGSNDTRVGTNLQAIPIGGVGGISARHNILALPVVCHNCGLIRFFHGMALDLVPVPEELQARMDAEAKEREEGGE
jgi:hypothetical protein